MSPDRLLELLISDSPRWLGEASHHLAAAESWVAEGRDLSAPDSPLLDFYRCIHAFKGACSLMASRLDIAARITPRLHGMEGKLAIKDRWVQAASWLPVFRAELMGIRQDLQEAWQKSCEQACDQRLDEASLDAFPQAVRARSGGRELKFPWSSILEFIPGVQVQNRPLVAVKGELLAVIPAQGPAHDEVRFGIAVKTQTGQRIVVPVQELELVFETKVQQVDPARDRQVS
jgi:hypothetical protein